MSEKTIKRLSIAVSAKIAKILEEGSYNKNKLINKLLKDYLEKQKNNHV